MSNITKQISKYNHSSRGGKKVEYIVIHDVGGVSSAKNNAVYFSGGDRQASAHYFVDESSIYQVVEDANAAWHCGDGKGQYGITNANSIGIEMCLQSNWKTGSKTQDKTVTLVKELQKKYGVPNSKVVRHYDASRKSCPNSMSANNWAEWYSFKKRIDGASTGGTGLPSNPKPLNDGRKGDTVKIYDSLYTGSDGSGRSTASRGKTGVIEKIQSGAKKKYHVKGMGWAHPNDLQLVKRAGSTSSKTKTVTIDNLNVYTSQSLSSPIVKSGSGYRILKKGTKVKVTATANNGQSVHGSKSWSEVDSWGWVPSCYLK